MIDKVRKDNCSNYGISLIIVFTETEKNKQTNKQNVWKKKKGFNVMPVHERKKLSLVNSTEWEIHFKWKWDSVKKRPLQVWTKDEILASKASKIILCRSVKAYSWNLS